MSITRSYVLESFDATTACMYVTITGYDNLALTKTYTTVPCYLPVDALGRVPTGVALTDFVENWIVDCMPDTDISSQHSLDSYGGSVVNAQDIYAITEVDEAGQQYSDGIPVFIYPDRTYTPSGNIFTRSVIKAVGDLSAPPFDFAVMTATADDPQWTLDNGNIYGSGNSRARLNAVQSITRNDPVQTVRIVGSHNGVWPLSAGGLLEGTLEPPGYIIQSYPYVYRSTLTEEQLAGFGTTGVGKFYYVEHEPLTIRTSIGGGFFSYS